MHTAENLRVRAIAPTTEVSTAQRLPYFVGISGQTVGATGLSMHLVVIPPGARSAPHLHLGYETGIYVLEGEVLPTIGESLVFKVPGLGTLTLPRPAQPPVPGRAALAFRPHQVQIAVRDDAGDASRVWVEGQIESAEFLGEFSRYRVRVGEVAMVADQAHYAGLAMFAPGAPVRLGIDPTQVRFLER